MIFPGHLTNYRERKLMYKMCIVTILSRRTAYIDIHHHYTPPPKQKNPTFLLLVYVLKYYFKIALGFLKVRMPTWLLVYQTVLIYFISAP